MAAVAQKLIIAACQQAASGWKMKIGRKVRLTCGPHINEKYAKGERATGVWSMENKKEENMESRSWNTILSLDSKCVLLRCSLNKLNLQTNAGKGVNRKSV